MKIALDENSARPIKHKYAKASADEIAYLQSQHEAVRLLESPSLTLLNEYHRNGLKGSLETVYVRKAVAERLDKVMGRLSPEFGLAVFDAFRSELTQRDLFCRIYKEIAEKHPELNSQQLTDYTRRFVADPDQKGGFAVPPHNSGGAIDLTLQRNQNLCAMGGEFDEVSDRSRTDYYESPYPSQSGISESEWIRFRKNRRVLFHAMVAEGFVNYAEEWWHYDLGDCIWSSQVQSDWFYESMEKEIGAGK